MPQPLQHLLSKLQHAWESNRHVTAVLPYLGDPLASGGCIYPMFA
jgi:hypothetical protein